MCTMCRPGHAGVCAVQWVRRRDVTQLMTPSHRHITGSLATRLTWCHGTSVTAAWQMWRSPWPRDERGQNFGDGSFAALVTSNKCQRRLGLLGGLLGLGREFLSLTHRYVSHPASLGSAGTCIMYGGSIGEWMLMMETDRTLRLKCPNQHQP